MSNSAGGSERRLNLLTGDWVLVSPHRSTRPWQGAQSTPSATTPITHDPACHLCAGNTRVGGAVNPDYDGVFVFENDFPALSAPRPAEAGGDPLLVTEPESGVCRVICYSPDHSQTMAKMPASQIRAVVDTWAQQTAELGDRADIGAVTVFENRGEMMGASSPPPPRPDLGYIERAERTGARRRPAARLVR